MLFFAQQLPVQFSWSVTVVDKRRIYIFIHSLEITEETNKQTKNQITTLRQHRLQSLVFYFKPNKITLILKWTYIYIPMSIYNTPTIVYITVDGSMHSKSFITIWTIWIWRRAKKNKTNIRTFSPVLRFFYLNNLPKKNLIQNSKRKNNFLDSVC